MSRILALCVALGLLAACHAPAAPPQSAPAPTPPDAPPPTPSVRAPPAQFAAEIDFARTIGPLIYRHQRAAHIAASFVAAHAPGGASDPAKAHDGSLAVAVTEQVDGNGTVKVTFIDGRTVSAVLVPDAHSGKAPSLIEYSAKRALTEFEQAKLRAQRTALANAAAECAHAMRPPGSGAAAAVAARAAVVISWRKNRQDVFYAYVVDDSASGGAQFGDDEELLISGDGARVLATQHLSEGCPVLDAHAATISIESRERNTPAPIDVFRALRYGKPVVLHTKRNDLHWLIEGDVIAMLVHQV